MLKKRKFQNIFQNFATKVKKTSFWTSYFKEHKKKTIVFIIVFIAYYFSLPKVLFQVPYATVVEATNGELLGAKIAKDGQWRLPAQDSVPMKFEKSILYFEDEHFYYHPGFNPMAMVNAFRQNQKAGKVIRGGSTLTQQVIRLSRENAKRTYFEKCIEIILATRLEFRHSKKEILALYAAHAPYGGNVVGLEMASLRYFGLPSHQLSWAETATLAVLPNAPSLIYPGKNQQRLIEKRNRLLLKLHDNKVIDQLTYELALAESLPEKPFDLPQMASHLVTKISKKDEGKRVRTSVNFELQNRVNQIVSQYYKYYQQNEIHNMAVLVIDIKNRNVLSYVGNAPTDKNHGKDVDIITAPRSTGSILKPFLYASMLDEAEILPNTLVPDIPTQISGYRPQNFNLSYDGAVPAQRALSRSLNIPAVLMLQEHGVYKFYDLLQQFKLKDIKKHPNHYGLSLILGGAESNLWDLCRTYTSLSSSLDYYTNHQAKYRTNEFTEIRYKKEEIPDFGKEKFEKNNLTAGSIWLTYNAMKEVNRPEGDEAWRFYDSSLEIAWKTGTSFGNRDAWAIGTNSDFVVGVWVGNASGEGRPELTGVSSAAPILFDVFRLLPRKKWFAKPLNDLEEVVVCAQSGMLASEICPTKKQWISKNGKNSKLCKYHKSIHLDTTERFRVNSSCEDINNMVTKSWFVLPPVMEWYYKSLHIDYQVLPPFRDDCLGSLSNSMDFIYPKNNSKIYLTKDFEGFIQPVILKIAHTNREMKLYWYIDKKYIGTTQTFHEMPVIAETGKHYITVIDELGNEVSRVVEIIK